MDRQASSIKRFCAENDIGRTKVYEEIGAGRLRTMKVGRRTLISAESAAEWRRLMERGGSQDDSRDGNG